MATSHKGVIYIVGMLNRAEHNQPCPRAMNISFFNNNLKGYHVVNSMAIQTFIAKQFQKFVNPLSNRHTHCNRIINFLQ